MTKLLNIDTIAPLAEKEIILNGKKYAVKETSVQLFLEIVEFEKQNANIETVQEQIEAMIALIRKFIPDIPEEVLLQATVAQLGTIVRFIRNDIDEEPTENEKVEAEAKEGTTEAGK